MTKTELEEKISVLEKDNVDLKAEIDRFALDYQQLEEMIESNPDETISVVYPYVGERDKQRHARWEEIKYSIRSLEKNFRHPFKLVIVGDKENWMDMEKIHFIESPRAGADNPPRDIAIKMLKVIGDPEVSAKFIWMNDDIYFVNPTSLIDIQILKVEGMMKHRDSEDLYSRNWNKTIRTLLKYKLPIYNYATHTPYCFDKNLMKQLIKKFNLVEDSHLITCLYHNYYFPEAFPIQLKFEHDSWKLSVFRTEAKWHRLQEMLARKKLLNHNNKGLTDTLKKAISDMFPKACSFEKTIL